MWARGAVHLSSEVPLAKARCTIHLDLKSCFCPKATKSTQFIFSLLLSLATEEKVFILKRKKKINSPSLTGFPNGNVHHVQRSHREKRLPLRLGHNEHDAKQVSAQQLDPHTQTYTCSFQYYALLLLRNSSQEWARVFSPVFLSMQMSTQGLSCSNLIRRQQRPKNNHMNYRCWRIPPAILQTYSQRLFTW